MILTKPKVKLLLQPSGLEGVYKQIELAGRTCYKSEDKITEDSAKPFVDRMINSNHLAMLEHGTVYLTIPVGTPIDDVQYMWKIDIVKFFRDNKYSVVKKKVVNETVNVEIKGYGMKTQASATFYYITTNWRVIIENKDNKLLKYMGQMKSITESLEDSVLQWMTLPTEYHEKRYTFRLITSIGVTRELNRHRVNSIAEQSTRYCNYSKDKFGREVTFCIPSWLNIPEGNAYWADGLNYRIQPNDLSKETYSVRPNNYFTTEEAKICDLWLDSLSVSEDNYMKLLRLGWQPQQAREVLPLCTATEIIHTAFASDWRHFFDLRYFGTTGAPHPNMLELTTLMAEEAKKHGIWNEISKEHTQMVN